MCRNRLKRTIGRLQTAISLYRRVAAIIAGLAFIFICLTFVPRSVFSALQDKIIGSLISILFAAASSIPIKEMQNKHDKVLLLQFVIEEYEELDRLGSVPGSPEWIDAENHCELIVEKILAGG